MIKLIKKESVDLVLKADQFIDKMKTKELFSII